MSLVLVLDVLELVVAEGDFVGTEEGALAVALEVVGVAEAFVVGGASFAAGAFVADEAPFAAAGEGLEGLEGAAVGGLVAMTLVAFTGVVVFEVVLGAGVTAVALFGPAATVGDFAVPAGAGFWAVVAAGLPLSVVVVGLGKMGNDLGSVVMDPVAWVVVGFSMRDCTGAAATWVEALAGGADLGACEILVTGVMGVVLDGSVLALATAVAVAVAAAAGGKDQVAAELGWFSSASSSGISIME